MARGRCLPRRLVSLVVLAGLVLAAAACSDEQGGQDTTTTTPVGPPITFVSLGSSETNGGRSAQPIGDTWPHLLFREAFPVRARFVNLARDRSTVAEALADQVPEAGALAPDVVTVWFGTSDAFSATPLDRFEADLAEALNRLSASGARVVVIVGPPPVDSDVETAPYTDRAIRVAEDADQATVDLRDTDVGASSQTTVASAVAEALGPID